MPYILYLQYCIIRHYYRPFAHCIIWSIWHF
nr:MAG TPA: SUMO-activating enzyme subunit 2 [Caudoviricetes sp.]